MERRVRECSGGQVDLAAQVQDLRDFRRRLQPVEAQLVERELEPAVDLSGRDEFLLLARRRNLRRLQQRRVRGNRGWIGLRVQVHGRPFASNRKTGTAPGTRCRWTLWNHGMLILNPPLNRKIGVWNHPSSHCPGSLLTVSKILLTPGDAARRHFACNFQWNALGWPR
jgi:hypothetical protein